MVRRPIAPPIIAEAGEYALCDGGTILHNEGQGTNEVDAASVSADVKQQLYAALSTDAQRTQYANLLGIQQGGRGLLRRLFRRG